jgi:cell division protein FtsB
MFDLWHERDMKLLADSLQYNCELQKQNEVLTQRQEDLEKQIADLSNGLGKVSQSSCCTVQ